MKCILWGALGMLGILSAAFSASALTINGGTTEVGKLDILVASADLDNSGDDAELEWVQAILGTGYTWDTKYTTDESVWLGTNMVDTYAMQLVTDPEYYMIKTGTGDKDPELDHFLFENLESMEWAVLSLATSFGLDDEGVQVQIKNIGKFSHVVEDGSPMPVPEPSTLLLMGCGLIGLAVHKAKRKSA